MTAWVFAGAGVSRFMCSRVNVNSWFGNRVMMDLMLNKYRKHKIALKIIIKLIQSGLL